MRKKGISPLLAMVLVIGLAVAVTTTVIIWGKGIYEERKAKEGAISETKFDCSVGVSYEILSSEFEQDNLYTFIENSGDKDISGFTVRVLGASGETDVNEITEALPKMQARSVDVIYDWQRIGNPTEAEFFPMFKVGADTYIICEEQSVTVNVKPKT